MANPYVATGADPSNLSDPMGRRAEGPTNNARIHVRPLYRTILVKLDPIWASSEWTEGEIAEQLEEARRIFSNQASIFLLWDTIRKDPTPRDELTENEFETRVEVLALSAQGHEAIPVIYLGRISEANEGGYSSRHHRPADVHRAAGVARYYRFILRRRGGKGIVARGEWTETPLKTTAHELGHTIGGLFDSGDWNMGIGRSVPINDVMAYPPGKTFAEWEIKRLREHARGVEHR